MTAEFPESAKPGPDATSAPVDLYATGEAPNDARYATSPREEQAWAFPVAQAGHVMGEMTASTDAHTADMGSLDGPFDAGTVQDGVPTYGAPG